MYVSSCSGKAPTASYRTRSPSTDPFTECHDIKGVCDRNAVRDDNDGVQSKKQRGYPCINGVLRRNLKRVVGELCTECGEGGKRCSRWVRDRDGRCDGREFMTLFSSVIFLVFMVASSSGGGNLRKSPRTCVMCAMAVGNSEVGCQFEYGEVPSLLPFTCCLGSGDCLEARSHQRPLCKVGVGKSGLQKSLTSHSG